MKRKILSIAVTACLLTALGTAFFFFRPIAVHDGERLISVRAPVWTVSQALASTGLQIAPQDNVLPGLGEPIPLDRQITIERAVQAYLWQNGQLRSIAGLERTPQKLLERAGIRLADGDLLLWNGKPVTMDDPLPVGTPVVLQIDPVRIFKLNTPQSSQSTLTHAATISDALWEIGIQLKPGDWLSTDPASQIESDLIVEYRAAQKLSIQVNGVNLQAHSAADTVGAALAEAGLALQGLDYSQPAESQPVPEDGKIRVVRVKEEINLVESLIPYDSQYAPDPELELDQVRTIYSGKYGVQVTRERVRLEDGLEISRVIDSDWTATDPTAETIGYGTKIAVHSEETASGTIEYWRKIRVYATSYSPCRLGTGDGRCSYTTASGARLTKGIVGVSLRWFRMMVNQQVYIPGYGFGVIADYGAVRGMHIDLGFDEENFEEGAIVGWVDMYFLTPIPAEILWTLP